MSQESNKLRYLILDAGTVAKLNTAASSTNEEKLKHFGETTAKFVTFLKSMVEKHGELRTIITIIQNTHAYWPKTILFTVFENEKNVIKAKLI